MCDKAECKALVTEKTNLTNQVNGLKAKETQLTAANQTLATEKNNLNTENNTLKTQKTQLTTEKTNLTNENNALKIQVTQLTTMNQTLTKEKTTLTDNNTTLVTKEAELTAKITTLNDEKVALETKLAQFFKEKEEEFKKINESHAAEKKKITEEKESLHEKVSSMDAINEDLKISSEMLQRENEEITRSNAELKLQIEKLLAEKNFPRSDIRASDQRPKREENANDRLEQPRKNYDCCIPMNSLSSLLANQSWSLELKADYIEKYEERMMKKSMKVAVIGFEGVGKTFLVNKLKDLPLLNTKYMKTRGISLIYPQENEVPCTILDTSGMNISIKEGALEKAIKEYFEKKNLSKEERRRLLYEDTLLMESLIEEFLFQNAQVLLVVVGRIRREDQGFLERIKAREGKRVIIIHNFLEAQYEDDVEEMIKEDIEDICNATKQRFFMNSTGRNQNDFIYRENDIKRTEHVVLAQEGTKAGDFCNTSAINYLKQVISTSDYSDEIDLPEAFAKYLNAHITKYLLPTDEVQGDFISLEKDGNTPIAFKLNQPDKYGIKIRRTKEIYQTDDGSKENFDNIRYRTKTLANPNDPEKKILQLEFEIVGSFDEKDIGVKVSEGNEHVVLGVKGTSVDNKKDGDEIHEDTRKFGQFKVITKPINIKGYTISRANRPKISSEVPGLMVMTCNLEPIAFDDF